MTTLVAPQKDILSVLKVPVTPELVKKHGLTEEEYVKVCDVLGRTPNLVELGVFSVMWSEHCSYKNSKALLKLLPTEKADKSASGQVLVKAGEENAGVVDIGGGWAVCFKIESHNHPSAVEPFEGAATSVGGILRDIFTMGARPALLTNSLRFGKLDSPKTQQLFRGVVSGIAHYGNCMGVPNVGGDIYFDECYEGNPLVNALCLGVVRHSDIKRGAAKGVGNPVYYVGAPTGRDGLGGASFASKELSKESAADRPAVQKGDPFMEKLLLEACLEMMAIEGLVVGIQDMGAAGLTCSLCETAARGNTGIAIDLGKVPARESGMNAYEYLLSESQERMLVIAEKGREEELEAIFEKWDLHAVQIGEVTEGNQMVVRHYGKEVVSIPAKSLTDEAPVYVREAQEPAYLKEVQAWKEESVSDLSLDQLRIILPKLLADPTIAEKRWVWNQYDHMVLAGMVVDPGSDSGVVRLRLGSKDEERFLAISNDCNNRYCYANPYRGAQIAVAESLRNLACSGARPLGMTNNLNFGNPEKPEAYYQLKECIRGMADACKAFDLPVVGGNVSLYNEHEGKAIDPTPVVASVGLIDSQKAVMRQTVKGGDESLVLLGGWPKDLGMSRYLEVMHGLKTGDAPELDLEKEKKLQALLISEIAKGSILAAHDISEGGLLVALLEMVFRKKDVGMSIDLSEAPASIRLDGLLFGESQSRVVVATKSQEAVLAAAERCGISACLIGNVSSGNKFKLNLKSDSLSWPMGDLKDAWRDAIPSVMLRE